MSNRPRQVVGVYPGVKICADGATVYLSFSGRLFVLRCERFSEILGLTLEDLQACAEPYVRLLFRGYDSVSEAAASLTDATVPPYGPTAQGYDA